MQFCLHVNLSALDSRATLGNNMLARPMGGYPHGHYLNFCTHTGAGCSPVPRANYPMASDSGGTPHEDYGQKSRRIQQLLSSYYGGSTEA